MVLSVLMKPSSSFTQTGVTSGMWFWICTKLCYSVFLVDESFAAATVIGEKGQELNWYQVQTINKQTLSTEDVKMSSRKDFEKHLFDKFQDFPGYWEPRKHNQTRTGCRVV